MDETLYRRVLAALIATMSPYTSNPDRVAALGELEAFKQRPDSGDYAMFILGNLQDPEHNDSARLFALQCLEESAKTHGADPGPVGEALRGRAATLLTQGTRPIGLEAQHIKEAVARLVSNIAERSFPQVWPQFLEGIVGAWQSSTDGTSAELCMMVLRNLAEDCTDSNFNTKLSARRRNDILRAITASLEPLLAVTYAYMGQQFQAYTAASEAALTGQGGEPALSAARIASALLRAALGMVRRFVLWVRLDQLLTPQHDFVVVCLQVLPFKEASGGGVSGTGAAEGLRDEAASTLGALCAGRKLNRPTLLRLIESLPAAIAATPPPQHAVDCLRFWRTIGSLVADVVFQNAQAISEDEELLGSPQWAAYLDLGLGLLTHPSLRLASDLHILFLSTLRVRRSRHGRAGEILGSRVSGLVRAYWPKLVKPPPGMLEAGELTDPIFDEEFVDEEELVSFFGQMRGQLSSVLRLLGEHFPGPAAAVTRDILSELLAKHGRSGAGGAAAADGLDERGRVTQSSTAWQEFDAFAQVFENIMLYLPPSAVAMSSHPGASGGFGGGSPGPVTSGAIDAVRQLLAWGTRDPLMRTCQINLLGSARVILQHVGGDGQLLFNVIELFFCCMEAGEAWDSEPVHRDAVIGDAVQMLRRRAGAALINLGRALPQQLEPHIPALAGRVQTMAARGTLREMQKMHCLEMLVAVSNAVSDSSRREELVAQISADALQDWAGSEDVKTLLESPSSLLTGMGLQVPPPLDAATVSAVHATMTRVANTLNTLQSICRRVESAPAASGAAGGALSVAPPPPQSGIAAPLLSPLDSGTITSGLDSPANLSGGSASGANGGGGQLISGSNGSFGGNGAGNPFLPLWPSVFPNILCLVRTLHGIWAPPMRDQLRGTPHLRHVLGMAQQELHMKTNLSGLTMSKTDGSVGAAPLEEMRPRWLNELRALAYAMIGCAAHQGALYAVPGAAAAVAQALLSNLEHMEHRHIMLMLKHAVEPFVLHCPVALYGANLSPFLTPLLSHMLQRLSHMWAPTNAISSETGEGVNGGGALGGAASQSAPPVAGERSLVTARCAQDDMACTVAAFRWDGGFTNSASLHDPSTPSNGALPPSTEGVSLEVVELVVDKTRRELTRTYLAVLQVWLALTGDLAKAFVNYEGPGKPLNGLTAAYSATTGGKSNGNAVDKNQKSNSDLDSTFDSSLYSKSAARAAENARRRGISHDLARYLFTGDPSVAYPLAASVCAAILWPDGNSARRATRLAHRLLELTHTEKVYEPLLGSHLFEAAVYALVTEPRWMAGLEWDVLALVKDIYCLLAIGMSADRLIYSIAAAKQPGNEAAQPPNFAVVAGLPRGVLSRLEGITPEALLALDSALTSTTDPKAQKDALREILRRGPVHNPNGESFLRASQPTILDLSQQLTTTAQRTAQQQHQQQQNAAAAEDALSGVAFLFSANGDT